MNRKGILYFLVACLMSSLFLAGCSSNGSSDGEGASKTKTVVDKEDKTLKIAMGTDIVSFDIHNHNNTSTEAVHDNMFNYLFKKMQKVRSKKSL